MYTKDILLVGIGTAQLVDPSQHSAIYLDPFSAWDWKLFHLCFLKAGLCELNTSSRQFYIITFEKCQLVIQQTVSSQFALLNYIAAPPLIARNVVYMLQQCSFSEDCT